MTKIDKNYEWFKKNSKILQKKYKNKYVVIVDENVVDVKDSFEEAIKEAEKYGLGNFIVQKVENDEGNIQVFHTRAIFR